MPTVPLVGVMIPESCSDLWHPAEELWYAVNEGSSPETIREKVVSLLGHPRMRNSAEFFIRRYLTAVLGGTVSNQVGCLELVR